ncbi:hypothetical protein EVAR_55294_1 [Eumeta japonica]|uniref:Uncharacterized protein n=1 Tax=Eumeta variegata TaxID=151549 RepID=A0A4C1ZGR6_EUMVA|nr:hypothetical protein EVAR_55294_1 [Eumeta japonica]
MWQKEYESEINIVEMTTLRTVCGMFFNHTNKNNDVSKRFSLTEDVSGPRDRPAERNRPCPGNGATAELFPYENLGKQPFQLFNRLRPSSPTYDSPLPYIALPSHLTDGQADDNHSTALHAPVNRLHVTCMLISLKWALATCPAGNYHIPTANPEDAKQSSVAQELI